MQEEEKRYRPGTNKYIAFQVLKEAGPKGLTVPQIMEASRQAGMKEFDETAKRVIQFVRAITLSFAMTSPLCLGKLDVLLTVNSPCLLAAPAPCCA